MELKKRIANLERLIPKLKANKLILPLKVECMEWELRALKAESKLKNNGGLGDVVDQRELLISFMEFRDEIYWSENEFTESKDIIELWLKRNK